MSEKSYGVSIDGDRVTVVETLGDIAISATSVAAGSLADSLDAALSGIKQKRNDPPIRVALITPSMLLRRIDVTAALSQSRAAFEDAVFTALPANREVSSTAGAFFDPEALIGETVSSGAAVIAPSARVEEVYAALGRRRAEVVAAPLALTGFDGIWFGIHHAVAEVTLVADGRALAYRQLRAGGLSALLSVLGDPNVAELGQSRLLGALTATGPEDPLATVELGRYLRMLVSELSQTLDYWRRTGESVPSTNQVFVYGAAAASPLAQSSLTDAGLQPVVPEPLTQALSYVPVAARAESLTAFCAAVTTGRHMPQVAFVNPMHATIAATVKRSRRRMLIVAASGAAAAVLGLLVVKPIYEGWSAARVADRELITTQAEFDAKADLYHQSVDLDARTQVIDGALTVQPAWGDVYRLVLGSLPVGADIDQISATADGAKVTATMSVTLRGGSYADLTRWLSALQATDGVEQAWSTGFSQRDAVASFVVSLRLDAGNAASVPVVAAPAPVVPVPPAVPAPVDPTAAPSTVTTIPMPVPTTIAEGGN
jgi:Tfp pilus assembly protein PilN